MKKALIAAGIAALMSGAAQADAIGLYIGGQYWANQAEGKFGEPGNLQDFDFKKQNQGSYYIAVEHPLPIIPNVKLAYTKLDTTGSTTLSSDFKFGDVTIPAGSTAATTFDLNYVDYTFYYEVFSNDLLAFDFGLTGRDFNADILVSSGDQNGQLKGSQIVPLFYASTVIGLPFTGFKVFADGNFLTFDDHTVYDYQVGVGYSLLDNIAIDLDLQAGYRAASFKLEDVSDLSTDVKFDGFFLGAQMHF